MLRLTIPIPRLIGPKDIICSKGSLAAMNSFAAGRVAVIATERASKAESVNKLLSGPKSGKYFHILPSWTGEPMLEELSGTIKELERIKPDCILVVGGGSVIDGAKLCWALFEHPNIDRERLNIPFGLPSLRSRSSFVVAPTTSGSGSEASSSAVYLNRNTGVKIPVVSHDFLPDLVILDPLLTVDLPRRITVTTALDALSHAIEGYTSKQVNPLVDGMAEISVRVIFESLKQLSSGSDSIESRESLMVAALYSGYVQNLRLVGAAHAIAHQLGAYGVPHGLATGLLLPQVMRINSRDNHIRLSYLKMAKEAGFSSEGELINAIEELPESFGVSDRLSDIEAVKSSYCDDFLSSVAEGAGTDLLARYFPVELTNDELRSLLESVC